MLSKIVILALTVAIANAWNVGVDHSGFSYSVHDPHTGDVKDQRETRVGNKVVGQYSLLESDGTKRIVDYEANPHTGFNAVVRKQGLAVHPTAKVYGGYAAPVAYTQATPYVGYNSLASPLAYGGYNNLAPAGYGYGAGLGYGVGLGYNAGLGYGAGLGW